MARKGDVELVIRAKIEATKAVQSFADELKKLAGVQTDVGTSAEKTDSLLGRLKSSLTQLDTEAKGLVALGKVARNLDQAGQAVQRLEKNVQSATGETTRLAAENDKAAASVAKLSAEITQSAAALERQRTSTAAARTENQASTKALNDADKALSRMADQVDRLKSPNAKLVSDWRQQRELVGQLRVRLDESATTYARQKAALEDTSGAYRQQQSALRTAVTNQRQLQDAAELAAISLQRQREALGKAQTDFADITNIARTTSAALGGVAANQDAVAAASKRAAEGITKVGDALARQNTAGSGARTAGVAPGPAAAATKAYRDQVEAVAKAEQAWRAAQVQANALAREVRGATQPTAALTSAFIVAQEASRAAKQAYLEQGNSLSLLQGKAKGSFAAIDQVAQQFRAAATTIVASNNTSSSSILGFLSLIARFPAAAGSAAASLGQIGAAGVTAAGGINSFSSASRKSMSIAQRFRGEILSLTTSYIGLFAAVGQISKVTDAFRTMDAVQSRLGAIFQQNTAKVNEEVEFLRQNALRLGVPFSILAGEYSKFAIATKEAGFSQEATKRIFLSVAEAGRVNRLSVEQMNGTFLALTQIISKGKVTSEELRRQLGDRLPGAFNLFAASIGVSTGKLDDMLKRGDVLASENNLLRFADTLSARFGPQLADSLNAVSVEIDRFAVRAELARLGIANGGFAKALGDALKAVNDALGDDKTKEFLESIGQALAKVVGVLPFVIDNFGILGRALELFIALKVGQAIFGVITNMGGLNRVMIEGRAVWATAHAGLISLQGGFVATMGAVINFRTTLATATTGFGYFVGGAGAARGAVLAFEGTLLALRGVMTAVAGVARTMWIAIGGLPGLVITGITFLLGELLGRWLGGVDDATAAMQAHEKILNAVKKGYEDAGGKVQDFASKVKGLTRIEVESALAKSVIDAQSKFKELDRILSDFSVTEQRAVDTLLPLVDQLATGAITAEQFRKKLDELSKTDPTISQVQLLRLIEASKTYEQSTNRVAQYNAVLRLIAGTATEADRALLGLKQAAQGLGDAFDSTKLDQFNEALDKMRKLVPEVKKQLKNQEDIEAAKKIFDEAVNLANNDPALIAKAEETFRSTLAKIIAKASKEAADSFPVNNDEIVKRIKFIEGGQNSLQRRPGSTAAGIGQFQEDTWLRLFDRVIPALTDLSRDQKLALRLNDEVATKMLHALTKENQRDLLGAGISPNAGNSVLAHFLGSPDAIKVILADAETPVEKILSNAVIAANKELLQGKTAGQVVSDANKRAGGSSPITSSGATEAEKFNSTLDERIKTLKAEGEAAKELQDIEKLNAEQKFAALRAVEITREVRRAEVEALKAGTTLQAEQRAEIEKTVGAKFDLLHAQELYNAKLKEAREAERVQRDFIRNVVGLDQQRTTLLKDFKLAQNEGNPQQVADLKTQLQEITAQIEEALPKAREFAAALGDQKLVASLDRVQLNLKTITTDVVTAKQVNDSFINNAIKGFETIATSIGGAISGTKSWGAAIGDIGNAFLQFSADFLGDIAKMILQQTLLNALQSVGFGGEGKSFGSFISTGINALFAHGGALVGKRGGWRQSVSPAAFRNAVRYHEGGIAGLKPGEVPAVLQKGEEVLTSDNPRHIINAGQQKAGDIKVVNAIDSGDFVSKGLDTRVGEKAVLNFIRANKGSIKSALGVT